MTLIQLVLVANITLVASGCAQSGVMGENGRSSRGPTATSTTIQMAEPAFRDWSLLSEKSLAADDLEIRIVVDASLVEPSALVLSRSERRWSGIHSRSNTTEKGEDISARLRDWATIDSDVESWIRTRPESGENQEKRFMDGQHVTVAFRAGASPVNVITSVEPCAQQSANGIRICQILELVESHLHIRLVAAPPAEESKKKER